MVDIPEPKKHVAAGQENIRAPFRLPPSANKSKKAVEPVPVTASTRAADPAQKPSTTGGGVPNGTTWLDTRENVRAPVRNPPVANKKVSQEPEPLPVADPNNRSADRDPGGGVPTGTTWLDSQENVRAPVRNPVTLNKTKKEVEPVPAATTKAATPGGGVPTGTTWLDSRENVRAPVRNPVTLNKTKKEVEPVPAATTKAATPGGGVPTGTTWLDSRENVRAPVRNPVTLNKTKKEVEPVPAATTKAATPGGGVPTGTTWLDSQENVRAPVRNPPSTNKKN